MNAERFAGWTGDAPWRLVWLPGAAMTAADVAAQGWAAEAAAAGWPVDMVAVDLQAQRYDGADAIDELVIDWLRPAREAGRRVWLGGLSLGGWQAVLCARRHPGLLDGLCLLAPYPGDRLAWNAIQRAGGLDAWGGPEAGESDPAFEVWAWWRQVPLRPAVWMGHGRQDRFAEGMDRMAARLSPARVLRIDGGHDWACWRPLWSAFLAQRAWDTAEGGAR
ncbi:alpha/beta hydrolase-fold protein [uncultured Hydrogenophaga sp.]|uniref:alpha/beta hydrolase-fold protein n=1 Tax=uncultured Hydrogenophaga sp. TaxID=199683 RepID=UPI00258A53C4|nr:alpha/beta hydrolase-fold protein [uncultured Hydrogenophaga sp.]